MPTLDRILAETLDASSCPSGPLSPSPRPVAALVGDWIGFGVSHPCTTFDKWRLVWGIDDAGHVTRAIRTYL
jgi:D-serine deaminase-like pyridoxal phosphate-dependent protein